MQKHKTDLHSQRCELQPGRWPSFCSFVILVSMCSMRHSLAILDPKFYCTLVPFPFFNARRTVQLTVAFWELLPCFYFLNLELLSSSHHYHAQVGPPPPRLFSATARAVPAASWVRQYKATSTMRPCGVGRGLMVIQVSAR